MNRSIPRGAAVLGIAALAALAVAQPARAWWRGGVWIGVAPGPVVVGPPVAYAPPYYPYPYPYPYAQPAYPQPGYAPPPAGYAQAPDQGAPPDAGQPPPAYQSAPQAAPQAGPQRPVAYAGMCYAGVYTCAAAPYTQVGATCACSGIGAPSYGTAR